MTLKFILIGCVLAAGILVGCGKHEKASPKTVEKPAAAYYCPMHPQIVRDKPGGCPICNMDLVPVEAADPSSSEAETPVIQIDARALQTMGVRTVRIRRRLVSPNSPDSALLIPTEALVREGDQTSVVIALGQGRFSSRAVRLGREISTRVDVLEGLQDGEVIVTSGQFLLDSEIRLRASASEIQPGHSHE